MKRTSIGFGVYLSEDGRYWARPYINRKSTWRLMLDDDGKPLNLKTTTRKQAIKVASATEWQPTAGDFKTVAQLYIDNQCPKGNLKKSPAEFCAGEIPRVQMLMKFFGARRCDSIYISDIPAYKDWRVAQMKKPKGLKQKRSGHRTVDKDTQTLSNILRYGCSVRVERGGELRSLVKVNNVRTGRPRYTEEKEIRHSREVMPASADVIHKIAEHFFKSVHTEINAWIAFFKMFTGNRISELLRLRLDAQNEQQPGFITIFPIGDPRRTDELHGRLYLRRSKGGIDPWSRVGPEFEQMIDCFLRWHKARFPKNPWYFPAVNKDQPIHRRVVGDKLTAACADLVLPHVTPHGFRSYYATKRLRDGARPVDIAAEIGDRTTTLIHLIYADAAGGDKLFWTPKEGLPAWQRWQDASAKIVQL